jgi:hypothetical protein
VIPFPLEREIEYIKRVLIQGKQSQTRNVEIQRLTVVLLDKNKRHLNRWTAIRKFLVAVIGGVWSLEYGTGNPAEEEWE